ncbi:hypothetical protein B9Z55_002965 [Caenorhabditis nigoni]|uniref:ShKT domain-containing protein n=1 Tax=Caenorhabditis nigoni TaxID=1611254 RepID=A0A2G5VMZ3_9PELO|nr:hypothetical protein B9Z55_002965 [Caenorhabditis nigoni]
MAFLPVSFNAWLDANVEGWRTENLDGVNERLANWGPIQLSTANNVIIYGVVRVSAATVLVVCEIYPPEECGKSTIIVRFVYVVVEEAPSHSTGVPSLLPTAHQHVDSVTMEDMSMDCGNDISICNAVGMQDFVNQYCQRTCQRCGNTNAASTGTGTCTSFIADTSASCRAWATNGFCTNTFYTAAQRRVYCATTCRIC